MSSCHFSVDDSRDLFASSPTAHGESTLIEETREITLLVNDDLSYRGRWTLALRISTPALSLAYVVSKDKGAHPETER